MKTLPSRRALALLLVATVAVAAWSPPGAALAIPLLALLVWLLAHADARAAMSGITLERDLPERVAQGEWAEITWTVRAGDRGIRAVLLAERFPDDVETAGNEVTLALAAQGIARSRARWRPLRRGTVRVGPTGGRVLGPRGLGWRRIEIGAAREVRIDPPVEAMRRVALDESRARRRGGAPRRLRGVGSEFESLRDYRPDDDMRWIDWKATTRRQRLTSREYQVDEHQTVFFLLDSGRWMATEEGNRSKLDHALGCALALGHAAMRRGDNVGLLAFDRVSAAELKPGRGRAQSVRLHEALSRVQPRLVEPDWARAFATLQRMAQRRSLIVVFTDLVDDRVSDTLVSAVVRAAHRHVIVVATLADVALLEQVARVPESTRHAYRNAVAADALLLRDAAITRLRSAGVAVVDAPADRLAGGVIETYLRLRRENRV